MERTKVRATQSIEVDQGIFIMAGAVGHLLEGPNGWPLFETSVSGYTFELAIENYDLQDYFDFGF